MKPPQFPTIVPTPPPEPPALHTDFKAHCGGAQGKPERKSAPPIGNKYEGCATKTNGKTATNYYTKLSQHQLKFLAT